MVIALEVKNINKPEDLDIEELYKMMKELNVDEKIISYNGKDVGRYIGAANNTKYMTIDIEDNTFKSIVHSKDPFGHDCNGSYVPFLNIDVCEVNSVFNDYNISVTMDRKRDTFDFKTERIARLNPDTVQDIDDVKVILSFLINQQNIKIPEGTEHVLGKYFY